MASNQKKRTTTRKNATKSNTRNASTAKTTGRKNTSAKKNPQKTVGQKKGFWDEGVLLCVFVATVFLTFSNFKLCGSFGNTIAGFFFGLFGFMQYITPVYVLIMTALLVVNQYNSVVIKKVSFSAVIFLLLGALSQMITDIEASGVQNLYRYSHLNHTGGGVLGGSICMVLYKYLSGFGAWVLVMVLLFVFILLFLNKSIVDVWQTIHSMYDVTEDDVEEYEQMHQERVNRRENQQQVRMEKKTKKQENIRGVQGAKNGSTTSILDSIVVLPEGETSMANGNQNADINGASDNENEMKTQTKRRKSRKVREDMHEIHMSGTELPSTSQNQVSEPSQGVPSVLPQEEGQDFSQLSITGMVETTANMVPEEESIVEVAATQTQTKKRKAKHTAESRKETVTEVQKTAALVEQANSQNKVTQQYRYPSVSLLKKGKAVSKNNQNEMRETAMKLQQTLATFGVNVTITNVSCGPAVTRYEMQPELGVKVSRIVSLADDIKLNLAAADIRIEAPIPGKAAVGIEVPNKENSMVAFRDLIEDPSFINSKADLPFAVGKDIAGKVVVHDIAKMPHLLVAGATGSGKSVCINTLIMSLLYKKRPDEVKLIMVDPKVVELNVYNGIPHLLIPVVTDPKKAAGALNWAVVEMMDRYEKFKNVDVRNLDGYNEKVDQLVSSGQVTQEELPRMPKIVIIVDELADLMMVAKGEVEDAIVRLSQLARAAGIHLVIATQRPSVDVITGLIKANVPSRAAFAVSSNVDSRTILDGAGAEKLLGKGDMLFYPTGLPKPIRVQGAFVSDGEVNDVVEFLKEQSGPVEYDSNITDGIDNSKFAGAATPGGSSIGTDSDTDEYFTDAGRFIIEKNKASIGMLQRVYKIGFNRAARIMDQLCDAGVVGLEEGTKPRTILMTMEEFENYIEEN